MTESAMKTIKRKLDDWDGKSAQDIDAIYESSHALPSFLDEIIGLASDIIYQKGATRLLKTYLEAGNKLKKDQIRAIYDLLPELEHWESRLHILQCLPFIPIGNSQKNRVEEFLRLTLNDSNKFVRAWAYNGFYVLSCQYPEFQEETRQFFEMAMRDEAASVRARIRNIIKNEL